METCLILCEHYDHDYGTYAYAWCPNIVFAKIYYQSKNICISSEDMH